MPAETRTSPKPRNLALGVVDELAHRIRTGRVRVGEKLPTETLIMSEFSVSRTVAREAISRLQAAGMVETRHGVGTFSLGANETPAFRIAAESTATVHDVIAVLELRIGVETEAAALAAKRRSASNLAQLRQTLDAMAQWVEEGGDAIAADFQFHLGIARATQNTHFIELMLTLGSTLVPRARLGSWNLDHEGRLAYLRRVNGEHESILEAITRGDGEGARAAMRTHLTNSRERRQTSR